MTYAQIFKRLFAPVRTARKSATALSLLEISISLLAIGLIYSAQYATSAIENNDIALFNRRIMVAGGVSLLLFVLNALLKPRAFKYFSDMWMNVDKIIMPKIIQGNNNTYEKIGTGRLINIYSKGSYARSTITADLMGSLLGSILFFVAFLITIYQKDVMLFFAGVGVLCICVLRFSIIGGLQFKRRKKNAKKLQWRSIKLERDDSGINLKLCSNEKLIMK